MGKCNIISHTLKIRKQNIHLYIEQQNLKTLINYYASQKKKTM